MELTIPAGAAAVLLGYLAGSLPTGVLVARARGVDLTQVGSGNIGATNVARALGKKLGVLVLLVDALKGYLPIALARAAFAGDPALPTLVAAVGLAAIAGHVFPIWLRLRGGKGVATACGVFLAIAPLPAAAAFGLWIAIFAAKRIASLASLTAATALPIALAVHGEPPATLALGGTAWLVIVVRHRSNIRRLLRRDELTL